MGMFSDIMIDIEDRLFDGATPAEIAQDLGLSVEAVEATIRDIENWYEDDGQPDTYTEYQDVYGGDDAFETCNFCEDF